MDGLDMDFSELDVVAVSDNHEANRHESFHASLENFGDFGQSSFETLTAANHIDREDSLIANEDLSSSLPMEDADNRGAHPHEGDKLISLDDEDDDVTCDTAYIGNKRRGEELSNTSPKQQKLGFAPYVGSSTGFGQSAQGVSSVMCETPSSSTPASQLPPTDFARMLEASVISPDGRLVPLTELDLNFLNEVCLERVTLESHSTSNAQPPFLPERAGSAPIPNLLCEFNKNLGSHVYVPRTVLRLREDGRDPAQAKDLVNSMIPPLLLIDSNHRSSEDLSARFAVHSFQAAVSGALFRGRVEMGLMKLEEEKKSIIDECSSLKESLTVLNREKEELRSRVSDLSNDIHSRDITLLSKEQEFKDSTASLQGQIDELRVELSRERQLRSDLTERVDRGEAFIAAFPDFLGAFWIIMISKIRLMHLTMPLPMPGSCIVICLSRSSSLRTLPKRFRPFTPTLWRS